MANPTPSHDPAADQRAATTPRPTAKTPAVAKYSAGLLIVILLSYIMVGFPDGAFTVSWVAMAEENPGFTTAHTGWILVGYSVTYTLAGILLGRLNRWFKLQGIYFVGLVIMAAGFVGLALSPSFAWKLTTITVYGLGTGFMASSMNSYMAKHFTAKHNNWMHFFWGIGATLSPLLMGQIMNVPGLSWRIGYFVIVGVMAIGGSMLLWSFGRKMWINEDASPVEELTAANPSDSAGPSSAPGGGRRYLTKRWHQMVEILTFFFLGGTDYTIVFFAGVAVVNMGLVDSIEQTLLFSTVYYALMTAGRLVAGSLTRWFNELWIIRASVLIAVTGILVLALTGNIVGMAISGLGLAPLLPTLVSDSAHRFRPAILPKIVGYELAAFGAGIAALFFLTSQVLTWVADYVPGYVLGTDGVYASGMIAQNPRAYVWLFPLAAFFALAVFVCNEILERASSRAQAEPS
ncbi:MAG: MFS transporter [Promicromonosporaceae bacterium]|nr:MFS transporter [Promicromonosporaceae bacterium]